MAINYLNKLPDILVKNQKGESLQYIETLQKFKERQRTVLLQCVENVPTFKRGFICDLECCFPIRNENHEIIGQRVDIIKDLVLVYINKNADLDYVPIFTYIFYK